jgi:plastocyanin
MPQHRTRLALATTAALASTVLTGCGGGGSSTAATAPQSSMPMSSAGGDASSGATSSARATIHIKDFAFSGPASVAAGATVTVMNMDSESHSVTADGSGGFDVTVKPGVSATFTAPDRPGSYPYHCIFHSDMHGTLTVK